MMKRVKIIVAVILLVHCRGSLQGGYEVIEDAYENGYLIGSGSGDFTTTPYETTKTTTTTDFTTALHVTSERTTMDFTTTPHETTASETTIILDTSTAETETTTEILTCEDICTADGQYCANSSLNGCICDYGFELIENYCVKVCPQYCPGNSSCISAENGCECYKGYEYATDETCTDIDECLDECQGTGEICENFPGYFTCTCDGGYYQDPQSGKCILEDAECPTCGVHAACKDPDVGCECIEGWAGDPEACEDVDECLTECQEETLTCTNTQGSYKCNCIEGYTPEATNGDCVAVKCKENSVPCSNAPPGSCNYSVCFPATMAGYQTRSNESCPNGTSNERKPLANRRCSLVGSWEIPRWLSSCDVSLQELANTTIETEEEREEVSSNLEIITSEPDDLGTEEIEATIETMEEVTKGEDITPEVATSLVGTIGNVMESPSLQESGKTNEILSLLETISSKVVLEDEGIYNTTSNNVCMVVVQTTSELRASSGIGIIVYVRPNSISQGFREDQLGYERTPIQAGLDSQGNKIQSTIYVPSSALSCGQREYRVSFYIFGNTNLFAREMNETYSGEFVSDEAVVESLVLSSAIEGLNITNLPQNDTLLFTSLRGNASADGVDRCAFWNESVSDWSTRGCQVDVENTNTDVVSCQCNHLTSFATLLDANDAISGVNEEKLEVITIVGCSVSSVALFLIILVFVFIRDTRKGKKFRGAYLLTSLCIALLGLNICLILSNVESVESNKDSCTAIAILIHFFVTCACAWMNCEATTLYFILVKVFYAQTQLRGRTVIFYSLLWGWFMPATLVAALSLSKPEYYQRSDSVCWVDEEEVLYIVVIPVFILIMYNVILYAVITYNMCSNKKSLQLKESSTTKGRQSDLKKFLINICIFVTVGVTWSFGLLIPAFPQNETAATVFAYIFTVLNSLQGLLLFFLYIVRSKDVRSSILTEVSQLTESVRMTSTSERISSKENDVDQSVKPLKYRYLGTFFDQGSSNENQQQT